MGNVLDNNNNPTFYNVSYGDSFKKWIDQYNALVDKLESKTFAASGDFVDLQSSQRIDGVKIFDDNSSFSRSVTINGDLVLPHSGNGYNLIETDNVNNSIKFNYSIDEAGSVNFVGVNGINFLSNQNALGFSLSFVDASTSDILVLDYENSGGTFKIASNTQLEVENSSIKIGSSTWNFPSFPLAESVLAYDTGTSAIVWKTATSLVEDLTSEIASSVALINTNEMMPVGTIIDVDKTKISNDWNGGLSATGPDDTNFYGWLIINGQTLTAPDENSDFAEIVNLINPPVGTPTYPRQAVLSLANTTGGSPAAETVKLIKYLPDAVSSFALIKGNGISFGFNIDNITLRNSATLKNGTTNISLNVDTEVFEFDNNGQLKIKTNIPRYTSSRLTTETPVNDTDAANKKYVLDKIAAGGIEGCCYDFMLSSDGLGYADAKNSFSIVDKYGTGRAWRTVATNTLSTSAGYTIDSDVTLNAISPFKESSFGKIVPLKKTFATQDQFFFIDENNVIYGYGTNSLGDIGASSRGIGEFGGYYNGFFPANPYNSAIPVRQLLPAFLPQKTFWNANVVLFESATGISGSNDASTNITIKTKDGYDNVYKTDPTLPTNGLLDYFNNGVPYTRGYYLSTGLNTGGQLGRGNTTSTNATTGPLVWGSRIDAPGRNLWYNFALTETQKENIKTAGALTTLLNSSSSSEQIRKRFNWFKPNAIIEGGLATESDAAALTEWRTQTGLATEEFNDYSWYIKKAVRTIDAHYVIVGKPGNESDNEVWCAGINRKGAFGNLRASTVALTDFAPMLSESESPHEINAYRITPGTPLVSGKATIFERHNNSGTAIPHGMKDFENLRLGTVNYYVILGNTAGQNRSTQFRLFSTFNGAQAAFIGVNQTINIVSLDNTSTTGIARAGSHRARCKGIIDISVSRGAASDTSGDGIILRKALTFSSFTASDYLDRVPENKILTDSILACGSNVSSRLGLNVATVLDPNIPVTTNFTQTSGKIVKMVTCNFSAISFLLSDQGVLYFAGNRASGCSDSGSITGTLTNWTPIPKPNVKDFFVIDDIDGTTSLTRIFVITEIAGVTPTYELYAGGFNKGYVLGTSIGVNATGTGSALTNFAKIIFPESPKNIVNIAGATNQTYILCKNQGEDIGRVYVTGTEVSRSYFPVSSIPKIFPQFKNIDRDIL